MRSALDIWNTPPPVVLVSLSFLKTLKCSGKISPFLTEGSNHDALNHSSRFVCSGKVPWPDRLGPFPNHGSDAFLYVLVPRTDDTTLCQGVCRWQ